MKSNIYFGWASNVIILCMCFLATWLFARLYKELLVAYDQSGELIQMEYSWLFRLCLNLAGYSTILIPGFLLYKYLNRINYFDKIPSNSLVSRVLFAVFAEPPARLGSPEGGGGPAAGTPGPRSSAREALELGFCFTGLMAAYLVWGLLQEKIMTQNYVMPDGSIIRFDDSQLLVFVNRLVAFLLALCYLLATRQQLVVAPLYKFSYCSLTNIVSTWCQYEALKYVSFPTQVLSKSCKVIPVMLMGKLISRQKYELYEYVTAVTISGAMVMFMLGSHDDYSTPLTTTSSGVVLLLLYVATDAFTATWQAALFAARGAPRGPLRPPHMLAAVNLCSCALTAAALLHAQPPPAPLLQHPMFLWDLVLLSLSSALGQVLIYRTIAGFGAVVFSIIMTLRQAVSILLSCLVYGHEISVCGGVGVAVVFLSVLLRVYCRQRLRQYTARARAARAARAAPKL